MGTQDGESLEALAGAVVASWEAFAVEARPVRSASLLIEHGEAVTLLRIALARARTDATTGPASG